VYNSGIWSNQTLSYSLNDLSNVSAPTPSANQTLRFDGQNWVSSTAGKILQVQSSTKTDIFVVSSFISGGSGFANVEGVSVLITPESTSSKILVTVSGIMSISANDNHAFLRLARNLTPIAQSTDAEVVNASFVAKMTSISDIMPFSISFLDSPESTSTITYRLQAACEFSGEQLAINATATSDDYRGVTTITAMEVRP
jgi:hypothetical protein